MIVIFSIRSNRKKLYVFRLCNVHISGHKEGPLWRSHVPASSRCQHWAGCGRQGRASLRPAPQKSANHRSAFLISFSVHNQANLCWLFFVLHLFSCYGIYWYILLYILIWYILFVFLLRFPDFLQISCVLSLSHVLSKVINAWAGFKNWIYVVQYCISSFVRMLHGYKALAIFHWVNFFNIFCIQLVALLV
jgi:hypothetical protein